MEVIRRGVEAFPGTQFLHLYGATETAPIVTGLVDEVELLGTAREKSAGQPVIGCEIVIRDTEGTPLPAGQAGEVTVRGANVMAGYWNKPDQTEAALRDGWYWSGDVGQARRPRAILFLLDRSKDMIISGGENVYCTEVEDALYTHPAVLEATVFGIPSDQWGEAVHAVVVLRDPTPNRRRGELIAHCRDADRRLQGAPLGRVLDRPAARSRGLARCSSASCGIRTGPITTHRSAELPPRTTAVNACILSL